MLKVKAGSWHYWVWRLGRKESSRPKNLCRYFWHCTFKIVAALIVGGLTLAGVAAILILLLKFPVYFGISAVVIGFAIALFIGAGYLVGVWVDRRLARKPEREERERLKRRATLDRLLAEQNAPPKPPGTLRLIWTFIVAKKKKYCPLIEVVDE